MVGVPGGDDAEDEETFWRLRHEHPTCSYEDRSGDFSAHKTSDFVTMRQLKRLRIYADYLRVHDIPHHLAVGLPAPLTHTKMFIFDNSSASGDFGERERTILELLRPHLHDRYKTVQAQRRAAAALAALDTTDEPLVLLDGSGRPEFATARARQLLASQGFDILDVPNVEPLIVTHIRSDVLLLEERRPLGLTPREREVLGLVAQGHTNAQIAGTLWISPATVAKHLEHAYTKLDVTTRTAAIRLIQQHDSADIPPARP